MTTPRGGMTIIELLLMLSVVAMLAAFVMMMPSVSSNPASRRTQCKNMEKNMGLALHNFQEAGRFVIPAEICPPDCAGFGAEIDMVEFAEHPERFAGANRPWWYVGDPADLAESESATEVSL